MIVTLSQREITRNLRLARDSRRPQRKQYVLVADDDRDSRETLAVLLALSGHLVQLASDGEQALRMAQELQPGIVFLDIRMPRMDGYEVCRQLRGSRACRDADIFVLTGLSGPEHERRCDEAGFTAQLMKPLEPSALYALFEKMRAVRTRH